MKIISWNIKINQKNPIENLKLLFENEQADIYCLQEINKEILKFLKTQHQFQLHHEIEFTNNQNQDSYTVILSKYVIQNTGKVHIIEPNKQISNLSKKLQKIKRYGKMFNDYTSQYAAYIDIKRLEDHKQFRIYSTHLKRFTTPQNRIKQFCKIIHSLDKTKDNIICGDLNILDSFLGKFSGKFFNSTLKDNFKYSERKELNNILETHNLQNPFKNKITFDNRYFLNLQLDHIIISENTSIINNKVLNIKKYGSDHAPILLEIE